MNDIRKIMPEMKSGTALIEAMQEYPAYDRNIRGKSSTERLMALSDIYDVYVPSRMSVEIYHKLYLGLLRSLQKKGTLQAVCQQNENAKGVRSEKYCGIIGGSDSFTIIGVSGIGKSSAVFRSIALIRQKEILEMEEPYCRIVPCVVVQCPFDSSVKGLLLEILRKVDEILDSKYYMNAVRARATTDMLIGSVSQVALNHIGLLVVDEIQNVVNSRNGKALVGMLTQLINNSGISICMVGTPESIPFFEQAMQLARRSLGVQYGTMEFGAEFCGICRLLFEYQYTRQRMELTDAVIEWLYEHSGGNISILIALVHDAQEISILSGKDVLDMGAFHEAYEKRLAMLHDYMEPSIRRKKQCSGRGKRKSLPDNTGKACLSEERTETVCEKKGSDGMSLVELASEAKFSHSDIVQLVQRYFTVEEVPV